ncbi:MAG: Asp23/Gls24 family envelope stress response protein [Clostridiales bacterium]|nr:Asp23/Gls24 family envelope stress response protein [Clostridiales bacterium]
MPENKSVDLKIDTRANGAVYFASDVIQTIAGIALTEVEGIANMVRYQGLASDRRKGKNANNIKNITRGVKVDVDEQDVSVSVSVVVEYGYSVQEVCRSIQENIKKTIETMTNMRVNNVDVHVTGLSFAKENRENAEMEYQNYLISEKGARDGKQLEGQTEPTGESEKG